MAGLIALPKIRLKLKTGEEVVAMGDIGRCELIDGRIVSMAPTGSEHGYIESNLTTELRSFVRTHKLGWVTGGEVGKTSRSFFSSMV